jgi:hypothetical protein
MAQHIISQSSLDSLPRSESNASIQSNATYDSRHSSMTTLYNSTQNRRRHGIFSKLGTGVQSIFRRISRKHKSLTQLEIQILSTMTHFNREEILQW